jgi:hypothetical protein
LTILRPVIGPKTSFISSAKFATPRRCALRLTNGKRLFDARGAPVPGWGSVMAIDRLLQNSVLGPDEIKTLTQAYEDALRATGLVDRDDPVSELVAEKIIAIPSRQNRTLYLGEGRRGDHSNHRHWRFGQDVHKEIAGET